MVQTTGLLRIVSNVIVCGIITYILVHMQLQQTRVITSPLDSI